MKKIIKLICMLSVSISLCNATRLRDNVVNFYHPEFQDLNMDDIYPQTDAKGKIKNINNNYAVTSGQPFAGVKAIDVFDEALKMDYLSINIRAGRYGDDYTSMYALNMISNRKESEKKEDIQMTSSTYIKGFIDKIMHHQKPFKFYIHGLFSIEKANAFSNANFAIKLKLKLSKNISIDNLVLIQYHVMNGFVGHNAWALFSMKNETRRVNENGCIQVHDNNDDRYTICGINNSSNDFIILKGWVEGYKNYIKLKNI